MQKHPADSRSPLHDLNWYAPARDTREHRVGEHYAEVRIVLYATDGETAFMQRIRTLAREVDVYEAPLDKSVPWQGTGFPLATIGEYRETDRTRAYAREVRQERFG